MGTSNPIQPSHSGASDPLRPSPELSSGQKKFHGLERVIGSSFLTETETHNVLMGDKILRGQELKNKLNEVYREIDKLDTEMRSLDVDLLTVKQYNNEHNRLQNEIQKLERKATPFKIEFRNLLGVDYEKPVFESD